MGASRFAQRLIILSDHAKASCIAEMMFQMSAPSKRADPVFLFTLLERTSQCARQSLARW